MSLKTHSVLMLVAVAGATAVLVYLTSSPSEIMDKPVGKQVMGPTPTAVRMRTNRFSKTIAYGVRDRHESIQVTIVVENDTVSAVENVHSGSVPKSVEYQSSFESQIRQYVVGKPLASISLSRIGGASNTTAAFMEAIHAIQQEQ